MFSKLCQNPDYLPKIFPISLSPHFLIFLLWNETALPPTYGEVEETYEVEYYYVKVPNEIYDNQIYSKNQELKELNNQINGKSKELNDKHRELQKLYIKEKEVLQTNKIKEHIYQIKLTKNILKKLFLYWKFFSFIEKEFK